MGKAMKKITKQQLIEWGCNRNCLFRLNPYINHNVLINMESLIDKATNETAEEINNLEIIQDIIWIGLKLGLKKQCYDFSMNLIKKLKDVDDIIKEIINLIEDKKYRQVFPCLKHYKLSRLLKDALLNVNEFQYLYHLDMHSLMGYRIYYAVSCIETYKKFCKNPLDLNINEELKKIFL